MDIPSTSLFFRLRPIPLSSKPNKLPHLMSIVLSSRNSYQHGKVPFARHRRLNRDKPMQINYGWYYTRLTGIRFGFRSAPVNKFLEKRQWSLEHSPRIRYPIRLIPGRRGIFQLSFRRANLCRGNEPRFGFKAIPLRPRSRIQSWEPRIRRLPA